jgi:putative ABC transport system permease protein
MRLAFAGIVIGLLAAFGLTRLLRSVLFEVEPVDAATFSATAGGLLLIALAAAVVPARRAARTDPAVVLREE